MKASKKLLSLLLVLVMMIGIIPFQALALTAGADGSVVVPVDVEVEQLDGSVTTAEKSFTVPDGGSVTLSKELAESLMIGKLKKEYVMWYNPNGEEVDEAFLDVAFLTAPEQGDNYRLKLKMKVVEDSTPQDPAPQDPPPQDPTTYTATLRAVAGDKVLGTKTVSNVTSVTLDRDLALSIDGVDTSKYNFSGWTEGSGVKNLEADTTFTAEFTPKVFRVKVDVYVKNGYKTTVTLNLENPTVELNNSFLKNSIYNDFDSSKETAQWYIGAVGSTKVSGEQTLSEDSTATFSVNITPKVETKYHNIEVYAVKYVGNVNKGVTNKPIFTSGNLKGTVKVLDYLNSKYSEIEAAAEAIATDAKLSTNPTFYTNKELTTKVSSKTQTDASKVIYVRVDVPEVKNVLLYVHKGTELSKLTHLDPKVLHGYVEGSYVTYEQVQKILGSNVKFYGLFTEERWDNRNASIKDDALPKIKVPAGGVEIHVWVTSGNVYNADSTNPKTGDYILDTAVTMMVISGLAAAAVYVIGKKRRV